MKEEGSIRGESDRRWLGNAKNATSQVRDSPVENKCFVFFLNGSNGIVYGLGAG